MAWDWQSQFSYIEFPRIDESSDELIASGGDLSPDFLLSAYSQGIFPWFSRKQPILWWSLNPRFVLYPQKLHVSKTMRKLLKKDRYRRTLDTAFPLVMEHCSKAKRPGQDGTWITRSMIEAYCALHELGYAHSVELWDGEALVGGLYGVSLGSGFFGESMFSKADDASKLAFIPFVWRLIDEGFSIIDCQMETPHLAGMGGEAISRTAYLALLTKALAAPTKQGNWGKLFADYPESGAWNAFFNKYYEFENRKP